MASNRNSMVDRLEISSGDRILVKGALSFDDVVELNSLGKRLIKQLGNTASDSSAGDSSADGKSSDNNALVIDLSGVTRAGSAGVSLLLSWARYARSQRLQISFHNLPAGLIGVAQVSGIDQILSLEQNHAV